jgi:omega-amidase
MDHLKITTIQSHLFWEDKTANLNMFEQKIKAISENTHIVVLPEMFSTGFSLRAETLGETMDGPTVAWMKQVAQKKGVVLAGSLIIEDQGRYYNRLVWMLPNGEWGSYDKRHCFSLGGEDRHFTPGNKRTIASVGGWRINLQVCYDLRFPVWARQQMYREGEEPASSEYDVLINVANWPEKRSLAWKTLLQARAIENQCFVVGLNRVGNDGNGVYHSGDSMVLGPLGEVLYHRSGEEHIQTSTLKKNDLEKARRQFPFWKDGDVFQLC